LALSKFLIEIINFTPWTWVFLWGLVVIFFSLLMITNGDSIVNASLWLFLGYLDFYFVIAIYWKTHDILVHLVNPAHIQFDKAFPGAAKKEKLDKVSSEVSPLLKPDTMLGTMRRPMKKGQWMNPRTGTVFQAADEDEEPAAPRDLKARDPVNPIHRIRALPDEQPLWTKTPAEQSWLSKQIHGEKMPNRHEGLFWGDVKGPDLNLYLFRVHLIVVAIYFTGLKDVCNFIVRLFSLPLPHTNRKTTLLFSFRTFLSFFSRSERLFLHPLHVFRLGRVGRLLVYLPCVNSHLRRDCRFLSLFDRQHVSRAMLRPAQAARLDLRDYPPTKGRQAHEDFDHVEEGQEGLGAKARRRTRRTRRPRGTRGWRRAR